MSAEDGRSGDSSEPPESAAEAQTKSSSTSLNETGPKQLCGWLQKQVKLPIKAWKPKWFVFDEKSCCLYYYNQKTDPHHLGKIDITMATLSYEVDNLSRHQFEILSEGRSVSLQASSSEAMMYWLTQLQNKRRRFNVKDRKVSSHEQPSPSDGAGGLIRGSQENLLSPDSDTPIILPPTAPPTDLEDLQAFTSEATPTRGLATKLTLRRLTRRPSPGVQRKLQTKNLRSPDECELTNGIQDEASCDIAEGSDSRARTLQRKTLNLLSWKSKDHGPCVRCQQLQERVDELESDLSIKSREVSDRDEINEFLRNEIRITDLRAKAQTELVESRDKKVDVLLQRNQTIDQLQQLLEVAIGDRDRASTELEAKRVELKVLGEQVASYKEALTAKDHVVVDLTNKLFKLEHKGQLPTNPSDVMLPQATDSYQQQTQKLEEAVEAYKLQNRFLSSELVELNAARAVDRESYKALESKYVELDANYLRMQSKHMILLQEAQQPRMGLEAGPDTSVVTQMLEEALQTEGDTPTSAEAGAYDRYGFSHTHAASDVGTYTDPLTVKARKLDQQAHRTLNETPGVKRDRWEALLVPGRELQRTDELKRLIRGGIPHCHRSTVWQWIIKERLGKTYIKGQFEAILAQYSGQVSIAVNQIELDLLRTLPTNKFYDSPDAQGIDKLRRILVAFSWYDPNVGYCQGLNRLAAIALLFLSEEDAFWCLVAIVHNLLPLDYYSHTLLGSQTDQRVLRDLLQDHASRLYTHLSGCDIDMSMITFNWFHTIFVDNLPVDTMLRIWDTFLYEGSKVLFRFAIAIFKYNEETLLNIENSIGIFNRVRSMCQDATDVNRLTQIAFTEIGSFPMRPITQKRAHYRLEIKGELDALEALRASHTPAVTPTGEAPPLTTPTEAGIKYSKIVKGGDRDDSSPEVDEVIFLN